MAIYFTSDTHFGHKRIIGYTKRPFQTWWEMDQVLIQGWNSVVGPKDDIYHLGDFALYDKAVGHAIETAKQLNGRIHLIRGNHDKRSFKGKYRIDLEACFESIQDYKELKIFDKDTGKRQRLVLFHYPILLWNAAHHGSWHLHGHCHGTLPESDYARIDVGVDSRDFKPMSYEDVKTCMVGKKFKPVDQHGTRDFEKSK